MLDSTTKNRIDSCRDILVGKVPDPKAQVEQITTALIYKFMDDMDRESIELGGKPKFFTDGYLKYSWLKLMSTSLGGHDRLTLYSEAIEKMSLNPHLPQLFRDIFKGAFLPYKDYETLNLFLKSINEFDYDHSEKLGDAFEYLLSILGSQGDAGQFRTPRHIIDFIVDVVDPQKSETVLDPACGTAGFLISAFKHILKSNKDMSLTPDEKARLMSNFMGYDISPDMVRLSLVNMYLHGFPSPAIYEYDTLTSDERWDDSYDVILANPPFMSPKGGIRPHKRFSIQAKRSEVLFIDYIAEHLNVNGRAGIIVPEGIIFQSQNAYKELRKMLVEEYLYAVVSLPAGVFQPYSGVKTSILFMDKVLAKKANEILFVKIENDGFDLGAQRRQIEGGEFLHAAQVIREYIHAINSSKTDWVWDDKLGDSVVSNVVTKASISGDGEYNLGVDRYKVIKEKNSNWDFVKLVKVAKLINGRAYKREELLDDGPTPVLRVGNFFSNREWFYSDLILPEEKYCDKGDLLYAWSASFGPRIWDGPRAIFHYHIWKIELTDRIDKMFLYYMLKWDTENIKAEGGRGIAMIHITKSGMEAREIPLPPLEVQKEIVTELDGYQKVIDGARQVVENYKPTIQIDPEWEMVEMNDICLINSKTAVPEELYGDTTFTYIDISSVENRSGMISFNNVIETTDAPSRARRIVAEHDILLSTVRPNLKAFGFIDALPEKPIASTGFAVLTAQPNVDPKYVYYSLFQEYLMNQMLSRMGKGAYPSINQKDVSRLQIRLPDYHKQVEISTQIADELKAVTFNHNLINAFSRKIEHRINKIWGV